MFLGHTNDPPDGVIAQSTGDFASERQVWRSRILRGLLLVLSAAFVFITLLIFVQPGYPLGIRATFSVGTLLLITSATVSKVPFWLRSLVLFSAIYAVCLVSTAKIGFSPNATVGLCLTAVVATLLFGRGAGFAAIGLSTLILVGVSVMHQMGIQFRVANWTSFLDYSPINTVRVGATFLVASLSSVVGICYLIGQSETLLHEKIRMLESLAREQQERERLRDEMERRESAFRKAQELEILGRLSSSVAHDFNNSLLLICSGLDELEQSTSLSQEDRPMLGVLRAGTRQALTTVRQLRAFGPQAVSAVTPVHLDSIVNKMAVILSRVLPGNIKIETDCSAQPVILADEGQIERVLTNLALNARDAMRDGGILTLRVRDIREADIDSNEVRRAYAVLEVKDNGAGMSEDVQKRMFEPFFTTKEAAGTGLGLASVRDLVEALGGRVKVTSALGRGSTISLILPLAVTPGAEQGSTDLSSGVIEPGGKLTVLVVDADPEQRKVFKQALAGQDHRVLEAADAAQGLLVIRRHGAPIDVLYTNIATQDAANRHLIEGYREVYPQGFVIAGSGNAADIPHGVIVKNSATPFSGETLVQKIGQLLKLQAS